MKFHIANMTCGGCARGITTAIKELRLECLTGY